MALSIKINIIAHICFVRARESSVLFWETFCADVLILLMLHVMLVLFARNYF